MLREIQNIRQTPNEPTRRWFASDAMDLIVWVGSDDVLSGFQLCYDKGCEERAIVWNTQSGLAHLAIDSGESGDSMRYKATPIFTSILAPDTGDTKQLFESAAQNLPTHMKDFIVSKIKQHAVTTA